jgi:hypothetical protein
MRIISTILKMPQQHPTIIFEKKATVLLHYP